MELNAFKNLNVFPIGDFDFRFDKRKYKHKTCLWIGEINIDHKNALEIPKEQHTALIKLMIKSKTDLLTDGRRCYTTVNASHIAEIQHDSFYEVLKKYQNEKENSKV